MPVTQLGTKTAIEVELRRLMEAAGVDGATLILARRTPTGASPVVVDVARRDVAIPLTREEMLSSVTGVRAPAMTLGDKLNMASDCRRAMEHAKADAAILVVVHREGTKIKTTSTVTNRDDATPIEVGEIMRRAIPAGAAESEH